MFVLDFMNDAATIQEAFADYYRTTILSDETDPNKLPAPEESDPPDGILEAIDMDSYRVEKKATGTIHLTDADGEIEPVPTSAGGHKAEPEFDRLSNIVRAFNTCSGTARGPIPTAS